MQHELLLHKCRTHHTHGRVAIHVSSLLHLNLQEARFALLQKLEQFPLKIRVAEEEELILSSLEEAELEMVMDLRPFMQRTPFIIHSNASLARAYRLFRTMGLHHLFVGPPKPPIIGVLTRKVPFPGEYN